jgi:hypothetical protein
MSNNQTSDFQARRARDDLSRRMRLFVLTVAAIAVTGAMMVSSDSPAPAPAVLVGNPEPVPAHLTGTIGVEALNVGWCTSEPRESMPATHLVSVSNPQFSAECACPPYGPGESTLTAADATFSTVILVRD